MLKILRADCLGLSRMVSAQFTQKMCIAAWNREKNHLTLKAPILGFKVVQGHRCWYPGSACYDKQQVCTYLQPFPTRGVNGGKTTISWGYPFLKRHNFYCRTGCHTSMRFPVSDLLTCVNQLCVKEWQKLCSQCTSDKLYTMCNLWWVAVEMYHWVTTVYAIQYFSTVFELVVQKLINTYLLKGENQSEC